MIVAAEKPKALEPDWEVKGGIGFSDAAITAWARLLIDLDEQRLRGELKE